jgi:hypothetical protein
MAAGLALLCKKSSFKIDDHITPINAPKANVEYLVRSLNFLNFFFFSGGGIFGITHVALMPLTL